MFDISWLATIWIDIVYNFQSLSVYLLPYSKPTNFQFILKIKIFNLTFNNIIN